MYIIIFLFIFLLISLLFFLKNKNKINMNMKRDNNNSSLLIVKSIFNNSFKNESDCNISNGFFYFYNNQTYLITTAHSIFYNWHNTTNPKIADKIIVTGNNIDKFEIKDYYYSRYFDVFLAKVSNEYNSINLINDKFNQKEKEKEIEINYIDINNNNTIKVT